MTKTTLKGKIVRITNAHVELKLDDGRDRNFEIGLFKPSDLVNGNNFEVESEVRHGLSCIRIKRAESDFFTWTEPIQTIQYVVDGVCKNYDYMTGVYLSTGGLKHGDLILGESASVQGEPIYIADKSYFYFVEVLDKVAFERVEIGDCYNFNLATVSYSVPKDKTALVSIGKLLELLNIVEEERDQDTTKEQGIFCEGKREALVKIIKNFFV